MPRKSWARESRKRMSMRVIAIIPNDFLFLSFLKNDCFKVFAEFVTIMLLFYFEQQGMWDLRAPIRDWTSTPALEVKVLSTGLPGKSPNGFLVIFFFFFSFIFISWRLITSQHFSGLCHTLTWISHGVTCIPHLDPLSHLPLHSIPLGLPTVSGLSTCLMHPTWAGDLFHYI